VGGEGRGRYGAQPSFVFGQFGFVLLVQPLRSPVRSALGTQALRLKSAFWLHLHFLHFLLCLLSQGLLLLCLLLRARALIGT
jgi:hypothetical protein